MEDSSELMITALRIMNNEDELTWEERREKTLEIISAAISMDDSALCYTLTDWLKNEDIKAAVFHDSGTYESYVYLVAGHAFCTSSAAITFVKLHGFGEQDICKVLLLEQGEFRRNDMIASAHIKNGEIMGFYVPCMETSDRRMI
ncbi:MAG: hypothetical protein IJM27_02595 [Eubacterium sp.]|nr:hypothetical protein [Eubacterium sp.]